MNEKYLLILVLYAYSPPPNLPKSLLGNQVRNRVGDPPHSPLDSPLDNPQGSRQDNPRDNHRDSLLGSLLDNPRDIPRLNLQCHRAINLLCNHLGDLQLSRRDNRLDNRVASPLFNLRHPQLSHSMGMAFSHLTHSTNPLLP